MKVKFSCNELYYLIHHLNIVDGELKNCKGGVELDIPEDEVQEVKDAIAFYKLLETKADEIDDECGGYEDGHIQALSFKVAIWEQMAMKKLSWKEGIKLIQAH